MPLDVSNVRSILRDIIQLSIVSWIVFFGLRIESKGQRFMIDEYRKSFCLTKCVGSFLQISKLQATRERKHCTSFELE